jgi:hypothetical protein
MPKNDSDYLSTFLQNKTNAGSSLQRQLSLDLNIGDISNVSDVISKLHVFNLDIIGLAQENIGVFMSVSKFLVLILMLFGDACHLGTNSAPTIYIDV